MRPENISKKLYWTPRILALVFITFMALMSLDIFDMKLNFWQTLAALFMHNLPVFILLTILIISWKREIVGGIAFNLAGLAYIFLLLKSGFEWYMLGWALQISGIAFLIGILFLKGWIKKNKNIQRANN